MLWWRVTKLPVTSITKRRGKELWSAVWGALGESSGGSRPTYLGAQEADLGLAVRHPLRLGYESDRPLGVMTVRRDNCENRGTWPPHPTRDGRASARSLTRGVCRMSHRLEGPGRPRREGEEALPRLPGALTRHCRCTEVCNMVPGVSSERFQFLPFPVLIRSPQKEYHYEGLDRSTRTGRWHVAPWSAPAQLTPTTGFNSPQEPCPTFGKNFLSGTYRHGAPVTTQAGHAGHRCAVGS